MSDVQQDHLHYRLLKAEERLFELRAELKAAMQQADRLREDGVTLRCAQAEQLCEPVYEMLSAAITVARLATKE